MAEIRRFTPDEQLDNWFGYHPPASPEVGLAHDLIRSDFRAVADRLQVRLPEGPDKTVAFRKLQEAMWAANACLACNATQEYDPTHGKY